MLIVDLKNFLCRPSLSLLFGVSDGHIFLRFFKILPTCHALTTQHVNTWAPNTWVIWHVRCLNTLNQPLISPGLPLFSLLSSVPAYQTFRYALSQKKTILFGNFSQHGGGVFPNPKTFVNLPSIFLYAKFILRC